jgi:hypothetical protein
MKFVPKTSHSREIWQLIGKAHAAIAPSALQKISGFIERQLSPEGGFCNRANVPDIYYTHFGLSCASVLRIQVPIHQTLDWLGRFDPSSLTLVDLSGFVKCLAIAALRQTPQPLLDRSRDCLTRVGKFRTPDGGFSYGDPGPGFPYAAFLALNIYQDLGESIPEPERLITALNQCQKTDGRFAHPGSSSAGLLLTTIAGLMTLRQLTGTVNQPAVAWVESQFADVGGFRADPDTELPDMLSTAVALFALKVCGVDMTPYQSRARHFIEDHWLPDGSFSATLFDDVGDCEYAYYGLLALGAIADE